MPGPPEGGTHDARSGADRLQRPAQRVGQVLGILVIAVILAVQFPLLFEVRPRGYLGMLALLLISFALGWLLGGHQEERRRALTIATALRNVAVGLVIATSAFPGTAAVTAVLAYGVVELAGSLLVALTWGRSAPEPANSFIRPVSNCTPSRSSQSILARGGPWPFFAASSAARTASVNCLGTGTRGSGGD